MTSILPSHSSPLPSPKPTSFPPSSFSPFAPPSPDAPSRPLPTHQPRQSSATSSPTSKTSLLPSAPLYELSTAPTLPLLSPSSFADRGRPRNTGGMLGVAWGSRRKSDTQLEEVDRDFLRRQSMSSRSGSPELEVSSSRKEGRQTSVLPPARLVGEDDGFDEEGELKRPTTAWMLGQRSGSCDSSGTESSTMTVASSASSSHSSTSTSTSSSTIVSIISLPTPSSFVADLAISPSSSPPLDLTQDVLLLKNKKEKKGGYRFGVLKGWLGSVKKDKAKEKEKASSLSPKPEGQLASPYTPKESSRSSAIDAAVPAGKQDAESDLNEEDSSEIDVESPASRQTLKVSTSSFPSTAAPLPSPTRLSQLLSPLQTFPFPPSFRRSPPASPTSLLLPSSPTSPTTPIAPGHPQSRHAGHTPPTLTPLQSLHLLSSQKLSLLVRPPPPAHPIFTTPGKLGSERRFPGSTNRLAAGPGGGEKRSRVRGLVVEIGVRGLMRRLEKGGKASRDEVDGLVRLFRTRPVCLVRDSSGGFIASIGPPSDDIASQIPPANIYSSALRATAPTAGSGILAFIARLTFEERVVVLLPDLSKPQGLFAVGVVTTRGLGVMELEFSVGLEALAKEIATRKKEGPGTGRRSTLGLSLSPPIWIPSSIVDGADADATGGRRSPTDETRTIAEEEVVVECPPKLPDVTLTPGSVPSLVVLPAPSTPPPPSQPSSTESSPTTPTQHPNFLSTSSPTNGLRVGVVSDPTPPPRPKRFSPFSRQSYPPPVSTSRDGSAVDSSDDDENDDDEDELPLAVLMRRPSFQPTTRTTLTPPLEAPVPLKANPAKRFVFKDRVRFTPDTVDTEQRERLRREADAKEREAREKEEERERLRAEEEDRKRLEKHRQEVASSRLRRESAKLGTKKGNNGLWEEVNSGGGSASGAPGSVSRRQTRRSESSWTLREEHEARPPASPLSATRRSASTVDLSTRPGSHHGRHSVSYHDRPPSLISNTATSTPQSASPRSSVSSFSRIDHRSQVAGLPSKRPSFSSFQESGLTPSTSPTLSATGSTRSASYAYQQFPPPQARSYPRNSLYVSTPPAQMVPTSFTSPHNLNMLAAGGLVGYGPQPIPYGYPPPSGLPHGSFVPQPTFGVVNPYFPTGFVPKQQYQQFYAPPPSQQQYSPQQHQGGSNRDSRASSYAGSMHGRR